MQVADMFQHVLTLSGQFIIDSDEIELDQDRFVSLVQRVVGVFNAYCPLDKRFNIISEQARQYTFKDDNSGDPDVPPGIPEQIIEVIPVRLFGVVPYYFRDALGYDQDLERRNQFPIDYRKPTLYVPIMGRFDVKAMYFHQVVKTAKPDGETVWDCPTIQPSDHVFFDLLHANFLVTLGRSRRAFTLQDMPITTDADQLISEGESLRADAMEKLTTNQAKFWLAWMG